MIHEFDDNAPIVLIGHSMGGAVAVRAAPLLTNLAGVTVIDVVEGTAMDALASMQSFLRSRPKGFDSIPQAIEWWLVLISDYCILFLNIFPLFSFNRIKSLFYLFIHIMFIT